MLHGNKTFLLQDEDGQITDAHIDQRGPRLSRHRPGARMAARDRPRRYVSVTDNEALEAFQKLCRLEGIIPALESAHALAAVEKLAPTDGQGQDHRRQPVGRGDKDIFTVAKALGVEI
jgi:tryptophan synthase beta chain